MGIQDPVTQRYAWQKGNMIYESWTKEMKEKLESMWFAYIWRSQEKRNTNRPKIIITERFKGTERQHLLWRMYEKISLVFCQKIT
jgi:hypothetical protein